MVGCRSNEIKDVPIIPQEKMIEILRDIHIAEGNLQGHVSPDKDSLGKTYYHHIFQEHDIKEADFYQSYDAFTQTPKIMEAVYDSVAIAIQRVKTN